MNRDLEYRPAQREVICRGCDKTLNRGDMLMSTYSFRNRGQHIYFCKECVLKMQQLIEDYENNTKK